MKTSASLSRSSRMRLPASLCTFSVMPNLLVLRKRNMPLFSGCGMSPGTVPLRRLDFDDLSAVVRQQFPQVGRGHPATELHHLQPGKGVVSHWRTSSCPQHTTISLRGVRLPTVLLQCLHRNDDELLVKD